MVTEEVKKELLTRTQKKNKFEEKKEMERSTLRSQIKRRIFCCCLHCSMHFINYCHDSFPLPSNSSSLHCCFFQILFSRCISIGTNIITWLTHDLKFIKKDVFNIVVMYVLIIAYCCESCVFCGSPKSDFSLFYFSCALCNR